PQVPPHRQPTLRSRAISDPFLDPGDRRTPVAAAGPLTPSSPIASPQVDSPLLDNVSSTDLPTVSPEAGEDEDPLAQQFRIFTLPSYLTDPEIHDLLKLFPDFISSKAKPIKAGESKGKGKTDEESGLGGEVGEETMERVGHGEIRIGAKVRDEGWRGRITSHRLTDSNPSDWEARDQDATGELATRSELPATRLLTLTRDSFIMDATPTSTLSVPPHLAISHRRASLGALPTELKQLIARMARDHDERWMAPRYTDFRGEDDDEEKLRKKLGHNYGHAVANLSLLNREWRAVTESYKFETIQIGLLTDAVEDEPEFFSRIKAQVRRITIGSVYDEDIRDSYPNPDDMLSSLEDLPALSSLYYYDVERRLNRRTSDMISLARLFRLPRTLATSGWTKRITSFTINTTSTHDLALLLAPMSSLVELRLINAAHVFAEYDRKLYSSLEGLKHLRKLWMRTEKGHFSGLAPIIYIDESWINKWKPALEELVVSPGGFTTGLENFIASMAPTLQKLSVRHLFVEEEFDTELPLFFFDEAKFPLLTDLELYGSTLYASFTASPLTRLHFKLVGERSFAKWFTFDATNSLIDAHLPTLKWLRLDLDPSEAEGWAHEEFQDLCEDNNVILDIGSWTNLFRSESLDAEALGAASQELLRKGLREAKRIKTTDDLQRAKALEHALNGLRVLLEMQVE
ncbi:hypothetical protein P7C70_g2563, partial [Phenoliferia sp. Uapishka_3]